VDRIIFEVNYNTHEYSFRDCDNE